MMMLMLMKKRRRRKKKKRGSYLLWFLIEKSLPNAKKDDIYEWNEL
jgi:hypothetical protein